MLGVAVTGPERGSPQPNCDRIRCRINAVGITPRIQVDSRIPENSGEGSGEAARPACTDSAHGHATVLAIRGDRV